MKPNKSLIYILPLIKGWSATADRPIGCYSESEFPNSILAIYKHGDTQHLEGIAWDVVADKSLIIHSIKDEFIPDYKLLIDGKYSQISLKAKATILAKSLPEQYGSIENVLYKSKKLKKHLENSLDIINLDDYIDEYESRMGAEEIFKLEEF
jgi:hypothetical protein